MPPANVLVADTVETSVPPAMVSPPVDTLMSLVKRPPVRVDVAVVVPVKYAPTTSPTTESLAYGEVVPMPTLPSYPIVKYV